MRMERPPFSNARQSEAQRVVEAGSDVVGRESLAGARVAPQLVNSRSRARSPSPFSGVAAALVNVLATVQVVWFYINRVPPHLHLAAYEQGLERKPFQYRVLLMYPMRWAHQSAALQGLAHRLNAMPGWFPNGVRAEGLAQAPVDLLCVALAGWVARRIYVASSRTGLLTPFVYPLTLVMIASTYCLLNIHLLRFLYDLPSLGFFAAGLELIYFRRNPWWLAALFLVATVNRETSIFLLLFFVLARCAEGGRLVWKRAWEPASLGLVIPLALFWVGWHVYIAGKYAGNPSESLPRVYLNLGLLLLPITWPQIFGALGYVWPFLLVFRREIADPVLRAWMWVAPLWVAVMLYYGILVETRLFGELIPLFACAAALVCERRLLRGVCAGA